MVRKTATAKVTDSYFRLIRRFPLRPIRSEKELDSAIAVIDSLLDAGPLDAGSQDYLDVLSDLVEKFEDEHEPMPQVTDAEMLRHLFEAKGITQARAAKEVGIAESTISEVLAGSRRLTRTHIGKLASYFGVAPDVFSFDE
jgi:HTH-type transcriptional regulator/antitoxin HigA